MTIISCSPSKTIQTPVLKQTEKQSNYDLLKGNWLLTRYSAFMSASDLEKMPDFSSKKVIYTMQPADNKLMVERDFEKGENDFSLPSGEYMIWVNRSMLKIGESLYMYHADEDKLILDSNYDPTYGPDAMVYYFERLK